MTSNTAPVQRTSNVGAALFWMAMALLSFTLVAVAGRVAGSGVDTMHVMFYRSALSLVIVTVFIGLSSNGFRQLATHSGGLHLVRNSVHFVAQYSWFSALMLIPLAQLFAVEFTMPLWVALMAPLLISERLTKWRALAALIGFCGILIIVRPGMVPINAGTLFAIVAAVGFAGSMIATKVLVRTETVLAILFHMSWIQLFISGVVVVQDFHVPDGPTALGIAGVALFGLTAHFSLARAFMNADAIVVAPMDFLRLPLIMLVGMLLYDEVVPEPVLVGAAIVVVANVINLWAERRNR